MNDIKKIAPDSAIGQVGRGQPGVQKTTEEFNQEKATEVGKGHDSLQVDKTRRQEAQFVEDSKLLMEELPDVRADKVALAKSRLAEGFYNDPKVLAEAASKMLAEEKEIQDLNVAEVKKRLSSGFYENPDVLNQTAGNIIKDVEE